MTRTDAWLSAARLYTQWFGFSVLPMGDNKRPLVKWMDFQYRIPTAEELMEWPIENLGIITGEISGLAVIDCESREDYEWFWKNRGRSPMVCKTRRGYHLYFRRPEGGVKNAQRVPDEDGKPRYDVRGDGGYVLAPPSRHSDGRYYWATMPYHAKDLPEFKPEWRPDAGPTRDTDKLICDGAAYIAKINAVSGQGGHDDTYRAVQCLKTSGLRESEALIVLQRWNDTNADPPWSEKELLHKIESVYG